MKSFFLPPFSRLSFPSTFIFVWMLLFTALPSKEGGGPNVFIREALNLVDFFVSNYVTQDVDLSTMEVRTDEVTHMAAQSE